MPKGKYQVGAFYFSEFSSRGSLERGDHGPGFWLFEWYYYDDGPFLNGCLEASRDVFGVATR